MKKYLALLVVVALNLIGLSVYAQPDDIRGFTMIGIDRQIIPVNQQISESVDLRLFDQISQPVVSLSISAGIVLSNENGKVRFILTDRNLNEYLVFETYELLAESNLVNVQEVCEETAVMEGVNPVSLRIETEDATVQLAEVVFSHSLPPGMEIARERQQKHLLRNEDKIARLNARLQEKGQLWRAGLTEISQLTYAERKKLYGSSKFPEGFEYYAGGVILTGPVLKSATASQMVSQWDWRTRHGKSWISPVKNQGGCGSCWAFAATGATEAQVNLYYNQVLNMDLSEQDVLSCSGAGSCAGGLPGIALSYITTSGIVDEAAFFYTATDLDCSYKNPVPAQKIRIAGKVDFGYGIWSSTEDNLKKMIIQYGPLSGGLYDWSHAMTLVGWQVVKEGDRFYYRDLSKNTYWLTVPSGSPLIGTTVWMFKNSWGSGFGDAGYVYVQTSMSNIGWTHALLNPVQSLIQQYEVICADNDGDGYYWWGLGPKPETCTGPDTPDGDDSNPNLGPLDAFGNCITLGLAPVADFTADRTSLPANQEVQFTDLSTNAPTWWQWSFPGGVPETSTLINPKIRYPGIGTFDVTLTVGNANGTSTLTKTGMISVTEPVYCNSHGYAAEEWIASVTLGTNVNQSAGSGTAGYQDFTTKTFTAVAGTNQTLVLSPKFSGKSKSEYWSVWIDYNGDKDFDDAGERVFSTTVRNTGAVSGMVSLPSGLDLTTRMRVSMKRNIAPLACEIFTQGEVEDYTLKIVPVDNTPVTADFTAVPLIVTAGGNVQFTDASSGSPTQWSWSFPGGNPVASDLQNPQVTYSVPGIYSVSLTVSKTGFTDTEEKVGFITVNEAPPVKYCEPVNVNSSEEYIAGVSVGNLSNSTGGNGYSLDPSTYSFLSGMSYPVILTPKTAVTRNYWRIWIDFNGDGDFLDAGETVLAVNNRKGVVTGNVVIPESASGNSRMRISLRTGLAPGSCDDNFKGEVEDYLVSISGPAFRLKEASFDEAWLSGSSIPAVYPNPAKEKVTLHIGEVTDDVRYEVYNASGMSLMRGKLEQTSTDINVSRLSRGIYFVEIVQDGIPFRTKLVIN